MSICKYCKKLILDEPVFNPDEEGNGYHHGCLCEMEFISRDRQIYNKGRTDALDKLRNEIECLTITEGGNDYTRKMAELYSLKNKALQIIDKYIAESEG